MRRYPGKFEEEPTFERRRETRAKAGAYNRRELQPDTRRNGRAKPRREGWAK